MEFFYVSFQKKIFILGFNNFILEGNKNIYGNDVNTIKKPLNNRAFVTTNFEDVPPGLD